MAAIFPTELEVDGPHSLDAELIVDRFTEQGRRATGTLRLLPEEATFESETTEGLALLTNGRGAMARLHSHLGTVKSKYDCLLGANLHPSAPSDRHIFAKRVRVWVNADGFITALDGQNLLSFEPGPPARWVFVAPAGDGRAVEIHLVADMLPGSNTTVLQFLRPEGPPQRGEELPSDCTVKLTLRVDLEDRGYHFETCGNPETDLHFATHTQELKRQPGFEFKPSEDRQLRVWTSSGAFHPAPEWSRNLHHSVESTRGMTDRGDAWSPGWFEVPLPSKESVSLIT